MSTPPPPPFLTTSVVAVAPPASVITTTLYPNATASGTPAAGAGAPQTRNVDAVPVAAIAGGAAGGVVLAVAAVLVWHLWGRSIKRKEAEKRKQAFAFFQLRENTRKNAAELSRTHSTYRPSFFPRGSSERKVKFVSERSAAGLPPSSQSTLATLRSLGELEKGTETEKEKEKNAVEENITPANPPAMRALNHAPVRPSPLARVVTPAKGSDSPSTSPTEPWQPLLTRPLRIRPLLPSRTDTNTSTSSTTTKRTGPSAFDAPKSLPHKSSNASSLSIYSTQSGEERQMRVPPSLIMAALGRPDPPAAMKNSAPMRLSAAEYDELNRLSHISDGSAWLQQDDDPPDLPDIPVGYAR